MATEFAYDPTPEGSIEVKQIPAGKLLKSKGKGNYFEHSESLFMPLFRYISSNEIRMTVPVEATIEPAEMIFWVAPSQIEQAQTSTPLVDVIDTSEKTVLSIGGKGSYNQNNFEKGREALDAWLASNKQWIRKGDAYAVYWSGPATPWFLKSYEIQIEIKPKELL